MIHGILFPSAEHAYVASKVNNYDLHARISMIGPDNPNDPLSAAKAAKRFGKTVVRTTEWHRRRVDIMRLIVTAKFTQNLDLLQKLVDTGDQDLIEGNNWNDTFWGQCPIGTGENWLGRILMEVRRAHNLGML
jgi:ribA/ribD-fused uncharacterized protein